MQVTTEKRFQNGANKMLDGTKYVRLCQWPQKQSSIKSYPIFAMFPN